ncbi:MAG TPA: NUDIX domain-containing protein [Polyangiaceae bacterium]|jgi:mutator protein MutT|nr:NUDIX domain-containing protein [Polyangiaceae bacterium]
MPISPYLKNLRDHVGTDLLLTPAVAAIIRNERGDVLFLRRADNGEWDLPAGSLDPGETPAFGVVREVREETGLEVEVVGIIGVFGGEACRVRYPHGDVTEYLTVVFECNVIGGSLSGDEDETAELRYFTPSERPALQVAFPDEVFTNSASNALFNR